MSLTVFKLMYRSEHVTGTDGASNQQCGRKPGHPTARAVLTAAAWLSPTESHATVPQPHEPTALHGHCYTLT